MKRLQEDCAARECATSLFEDVLVLGDMHDIFFEALVPKPEELLGPPAWNVGWTCPRAVSRSMKASFDAKVSALYGCPRALGLRAEPPQLESVLQYFRASRRNAADSRAYPIPTAVNRLHMAIATSQRVASLAELLGRSSLRWTSVEQVREHPVAKVSAMTWLSKNSVSSPQGGARRVAERLAFVDALYYRAERLPPKQAAFVLNHVELFANQYAGLVGGDCMAKTTIRSIQSVQRRDIEYSLRDQAAADDRTTHALLLKERVVRRLEEQIGVSLSENEFAELVRTSSVCALALDPEKCDHFAWSAAFTRKTKVAMLSGTLAINYANALEGAVAA